MFVHTMTILQLVNIEKDKRENNLLLSLEEIVDIKSSNKLLCKSCVHRKSQQRYMRITELCGDYSFVPVS